jgi:hypothetical protein
MMLPPQYLKLDCFSLCWIGFEPTLWFLIYAKKFCLAVLLNSLVANRMGVGSLTQASSFSLCHTGQ